MHTGKWLPLAALLILTAFSAAGCRETVMTTETQTRTTIPPDAQGDAASTNPDISADGRFVVFKSDATNLVVGSTNGARTIYIRDTQTGVTTRVSSDSAGINGNKDSDNPAISADGRFVAFDSIATNLVPGDTGSQCVSTSGTNINCPDVFIKNLETGETRLVSVAAGGEPGNRESQQPAISADGRFVAFRSAATNLVQGDTNGKADVFLKDMQTGKVTRVSVGAEGSEGNEDSEQPAISADGRYIAFHSLSESLVADDTNSKMDVYLKDIQTGALTRVSTSADNSQGDESSGFFNLALSADGRFVAFESGASNLVADDLNGKRDIFLKDTQTGAISLVSVSATGAQGDEDSFRSIAVSTDGSFVAFSSDAPNLVPADGNAASGKTDVFVRDMKTGAIICVSTSTGGAAQGMGRSEFLAMSGDGRFVAFSSEAANLVAGDTNNKADVFLKDTKTGTTGRLSTSTADTGPPPGLTITDAE
ncbi:MAG: PD40 domain-containing protein [Actinobacteria bacterium]|nr:PD40 domain-containing protein [Actinomycetota bacterium]